MAHELLVLAAQGADAQAGVDPVTTVVDSLESMARGFIGAIPNLALALVVLVVVVLIGRVVSRRAVPRLAALRTPSFGRVAGSLLYAAFWVAGLAVSLPIAFEGVSIATMLGGLGLVGVAAGFAFQDILSNLLAGVLLIFRQPFRSGDQISVNGVSGTVQAITIRETQIKTFDGRLVFVPNADVYTNAIEVQTADERVRTSLVVGVDYDADLGQARDVALEAMAGIDAIAESPAPQAYYTDFGASSINLDLRYWTGSRQAEIRRVQDAVVERIKAGFDDAGIGIPFDIVTLEAGKSLEGAVEARRREAVSNVGGNGR